MGEGAALLTVGVRGPDYDLPALRSWTRWRPVLKRALIASATIIAGDSSRNRTILKECVSGTRTAPSSSAIAMVRAESNAVDVRWAEEVAHAQGRLGVRQY